MQKKGEMSRLTINLLIGFLILALAVIIFIIVRGYTQETKHEVLSDDDIDLKISQVKQIDDSNLGLTLRRNFGEGSFSGLSFIVYDGVNLEIIKLDAFIEENDSEELSLYFNQVNASRIKSISVSTIYTNEEGLKVTGGVKDEYITPDTCSNYCPPNAQCGITGCGLFCGSEDGKCKSGYSCVNYKCVKDKSSSGSGDSGGGSTTPCTDTCNSLGYRCGTYTICEKSVKCGECGNGYTCNDKGVCVEIPINCEDSCSSLGYECGFHDVCGISTNCNECSVGYECNSTGKCVCKSESNSEFCTRLARQCGSVTANDNCGTSRTVNCGTCQSGYNCDSSGLCIAEQCVPESNSAFCLRLGKNCGSVTALNNCGNSKTVNCGSCSSPLTCGGGGTANVCGCTVSSYTPALNTFCGSRSVTTNCGTTITMPGTLTCQTGYSCAANGSCVKDSADCIASTSCSSFGKNCGTISNGCSGTLNCGTCSTGKTCFNNVCVNSNEVGDLNVQQQNSDCGDILDYQCGIRTICDKNVDFGNCPSGYICNNNLCIASDSKSCNGVVCPSGEYCSHGVCLLSVSGNTYFVATWGKDSNSGTFEQPFYSWQKVVSVLKAGDIAYFRGGIWQPIIPEGTHGSNLVMSIWGPRGYNNGKSGTASKPIRYYNYPGERPIYDGQFVGIDSAGWGGGISMGDIQYVYLRGLTVRNVHQSPPNPARTGKPNSEVSGISCAQCANMIYENLVVHDIDGRGFQHWSGAWAEYDAQYAVSLGYGYTAPYYESDNTVWINCDAYNLYDRYSLEPGNAADGWKVETYYVGNFNWINCRAFNYSDDGFDPHGSGKRVFDGCWAIPNTRYDEISSSWNNELNGFKMTGVIPETVPNYRVGGENLVIVKNSIAAECGWTGILNNILVNYVDQWPNNGLLYNNFVYRSGIGYSDSNASVYYNNIVYDSQLRDPTGKKYEVSLYNAWIQGSHNTWIFHPYSGDWWWNYNPTYTVNNADFVSLDIYELMKPRKADFSLPDVNFGKLKQGSDLINAGTVVQGYHCATSGAHPGQNCREWYGSAPDLGPFESNY